jgi:hypothetical protein
LGFLKQGLGLVAQLGLFKVVGFLCSSTFFSHIVMPKKVGDKYNRPVDYTGHVWKGLSPTGVQAWPWNPKTDSLLLSDLTKETGCEANNGLALLKKANFQPLSVVSLPKFSSVVEERKIAKK